MSARSQVCGGARPGPGVPGGRRTVGLAVVGPWQYQCIRQGGYTGWVGGYPVYPSPVPTHPYRARTAARAVASGARAGSVAGTCTYDRFRCRQGDPRGR